MLSLGPFLIFFPQEPDIFFSARLISQQAWFHRPHFSKFSFEEWFCNHGPHPLLAQEDFLIEFFQANKHLHVGSVGLLGFFFLRKLGLRLPFKMTVFSRNHFKSTVFSFHLNALCSRISAFFRACKQYYYMLILLQKRLVYFSHQWRERDPTTHTKKKVQNILLGFPSWCFFHHNHLTQWDQNKVSTKALYFPHGCHVNPAR